MSMFTALESVMIHIRLILSHIHYLLQNNSAQGTTSASISNVKCWMRNSCLFSDLSNTLESSS